MQPTVLTAKIRIQIVAPLKEIVKDCISIISNNNQSTLTGQQWASFYFTTRLFDKYFLASLYVDALLQFLDALTSQIVIDFFA